MFVLSARVPNNRLARVKLNTKHSSNQRIPRNWITTPAASKSDNPGHKKLELPKCGFPVAKEKFAGVAGESLLKDGI